jgi:uncharacterized protein (DUF488 family)
MTIYTIGHSYIAIEHFIDLLRLHLIEVLIDTRSQPYSRYAPQFNRESLKTSLQQAEITYLYLGDELGGRPREAQYYLPNGKVDYDRLAKAPFYREGLERLKQEAERRCLAIMCSEADYHECHRHKLIARSLVHEDVEVLHIVHSGALAQTDPRELRPAARQLDLFEEGARESERFYTPNH